MPDEKVIDPKLREKPLTRTEASRISRWLHQVKEIRVDGGWTAIHKLTATQIAKRYKVNADDVVREARLDVTIEGQA